MAYFEMGMPVHCVDPCAAAAAAYVVEALTWHETVEDLGRAAEVHLFVVARRLQSM